MDRLPWELVHKIVTNLYDPSDPTCCDNLLLVSRCFQAAVEVCTGRFRSRVIRGGVEIGDFVNIFMKYRRASYLSDLVYVVYPRLPSAMSTNPAHWSANGLNKLHASVTTQISQLFCAIHSLERHPDPNSRPRSMSLEIRSSPESCYRLWPYWRQRLLFSGHLPNLESITCFCLGETERELPRESYSPEALEPNIVAQLLPKFPNLEKLKAAYLHDDPCAESTCNGHASHIEAYQGPRRDARHFFSQAITQIVEMGYIPSRLCDVKLHFGHAITGRQQDQTRTLPDLISPHHHDPLSSSLRLFTLNTQNLRTLTLSGCFDLTLLVPPPLPPTITDNSPTTATTTRQTWPNLETLRVIFFPEAPDGSWYFQGHVPPLPPPSPPSRQDQENNTNPSSNGYVLDHTHYPSPKPIHPCSAQNSPPPSPPLAPDSLTHTSQHLFRMSPIPEKVEPLLSAFARATDMRHMPRLRKSSLWFPLHLLSEDDFFDLAPSRQVCHNAWGVCWEYCVGSGGGGGGGGGGGNGGGCSGSRNGGGGGGNGGGGNKCSVSTSCAIWITLGWRPSCRVHELLQRSWGRRGDGDGDGGKEVKVKEQWVEYLEELDGADGNTAVVWPE